MEELECCKCDCECKNKNYSICASMIMIGAGLVTLGTYLVIKKIKED